MSTGEDLTDLTQLSGVGKKTASKLEDGGYTRASDIAAASPGELQEKAGVGENNAEKIIRSARDETDVGGFETATDVKERRKEIGELSWGVDDIDALLGGGIETQNITEVYGEFGSGKSQVTHQLSVNVQLPLEHGGLGGAAMYIDTEDTFRPNRIEDMVRGLPDEALAALMEERGIAGDPDHEEAMGELVQSVLNNIHVAKAFNANHQIVLGQQAKEKVGETNDADNDELPIRVVSVDSLTSHFRAEYVGRGELAERQQKLNKHIHDLKTVGNQYNAAVIVTNQVASNPDSYFGDPTEPIGGNIVGHASTYRLYLRKSKDNKRVVKLVDAPDCPEGEAVMRVADGGLKPE